MLYANVHILDINISEKCQKRKDIPSSSSMQPRKHATKRSKQSLLYKVTPLKEPKKINSLSLLKFNEVTHLVNLCLLPSFMLRITMKPEQIEYFET